MSFCILALESSGLVPWRSLGATPVALGRAPNNDLVFNVPTVSWHHAAVWLHRGRVWLRDSNSRHGTWLDGQRVHGAVPVRPKQVIRLGVDAQIEVHRAGTTAPEHPCWLVEEIGSPRATRVVDDEVLLHDGAGGMLPVAVARDGTVHIRSSGVAAGNVFRVGRATYRVVPAESEVAPTANIDVRRGPTTLDTRVRVGLTADGRALVSIEQPGRPIYTLRPSLPARLFAALAQQTLADLGAGLADADIGWIVDADLAQILWTGASATADRARVLVNRARTDLVRASLDEERVLQRIQGASRLVTADVRVQPL